MNSKLEGLFVVDEENNIGGCNGILTFDSNDYLLVAYDDGRVRTINYLDDIHLFHTKAAAIAFQAESEASEASEAAE